MDTDTFVTTVYVVVDDLCRVRPDELQPNRRGPKPVLSESEVITLALLSQWHGRGSERAFLLFADRNWSSYFPLIGQSGFNKRVRALHSRIAGLALEVGKQVQHLMGTGSMYEAMDGVLVPLMRICRGRRRRLFAPDEAAIGKGGSDRRWEYGIKLLAVVEESGCVSGFVAGPASTEERWLAEGLLSWRHDPHSPQPSAVGLAGMLGPAHRKGGQRRGPTGGLWPVEGAGEATGEAYLADRGFSGHSWGCHWSHSYGARIITPRNASEQFASPRELNSRRQIVETVFGILCDTFRLKFPRARTIEGLQARIACKIAALNIGILINQVYGRRKFEIFNPIA
jgi:hypothetical protein